MEIWQSTYRTNQLSIVALHILMEVAKLIYGTTEITHGSTLEMATVIWAATHN